MHVCTVSPAPRCALRSYNFRETLLRPSSIAARDGILPLYVGQLRPVLCCLTLFPFASTCAERTSNTFSIRLVLSVAEHATLRACIYPKVCFTSPHLPSLHTAPHRSDTGPCIELQICANRGALGPKPCARWGPGLYRHVGHVCIVAKWESYTFSIKQ
jgi:hypothetical protein